MLKKILIGFLVFAGCGLIGITGLVGYVFYNAYPSYTVVAKEVEITPEWTEVTMTAPMKAELDRQMLLLSGNGLDTRGFEAVLPDGTVVKPEIQVIDDQGNAYDFASKHYEFPGTRIRPCKRNGIPERPFICEISRSKRYFL